ncbi:c-type cytochrome [Guyparkeria halophila]|uniref:C-type cytochrome n=1 Tax=Guyparkeria halophila TaxID=47960 RepID=A0ABZ0YZ94_9GAMM|nr:c-type cytochrome [Guyparkeria halophila]WQH16541.1 c-type cytochrome [Guyparkeria halophila]
MMTAVHPMPRRGRFAAGMLMGLSFLAGAAHASEAGSIKAGREAAQSCAACHGAKGNSNNPAFPSLAGQPATYLASQLTAYRDGKRENAIMAGQAAGLSDQQIQDIAAYYAAQERKVASPADEGSALGADLYHHGRDNVAACAACHHSEGHGNQPAGFPALRGLSAGYVAQSLKDYRSGTRAHGQAELMIPLAAELSDAEIDALAAHIASLD